MKNSFYSLFLILLLISCKESKYKSSEKIHDKQIASLQDLMAQKNHTVAGMQTEFIGTVNFNLRKPNYIILHHTGQDSQINTIKTFTSSKHPVSAHYIVEKNGAIIQMLNDYFRAWHAGEGTWGKSTDMNSNSIGIELENDGSENFTSSQINSLLALLGKLKTKYNIPTPNITAHAGITPGRKNDPSVFFPWETLAQNGFGVYPNYPLKNAPKDFNTEMGLKIIGYNTKKLYDAVSAFKLHYIPIEADTILDQKTVNTIHDIYLKHM
jgi:N-acetylmuramoyl-L-alanine amidase